MIQTSILKIRTTWRSLAVGLALLGIVASAVVPAQTTLALDSGSYSCGAYGGGNYSHTAGSADCPGSNVSAPNTGFGAKLLEPTSIATIIGSLLLLVAGIAIILKLKSRKKQNISFTKNAD